MERFYENVLGLVSLGLGRWSLAFRLGEGVVLLFDRERSSTQDEPPPHGASGSIHAAFLAAPGEYDAWKQRLADRGVTLIDELVWRSGVRSCYFNDPSGRCADAIAARSACEQGLRPVREHRGAPLCRLCLAQRRGRCGARAIAEATVDLEAPTSTAS